MKGISLPLAMILVTLFLIAAMGIPIFFTRVQIKRTIIAETGFNRASSTLLALLSVTDDDGNPLYRDITKCVAATYCDSVKYERIKSVLDKLVENGAYNLSYIVGKTESTLVQSGSPKKYHSEAPIILPYRAGKANTAILKLVID